MRLPPIYTLFPYTTLFRSPDRLRPRHTTRPAARALNPVRRKETTDASKTDISRYVAGRGERARSRSEEHTSELQSRLHLVCRLLLEKKNWNSKTSNSTHSR